MSNAIKRIEEVEQKINGSAKLAAWKLSPASNPECAWGRLPTFSYGFDAGYQAALSDLKAERDTDKVDAERYRELKRQNCCRDNDVLCVFIDVDDGLIATEDNAQIDERLDAAIAQQKGRKV
jgi:hypothetical protein